MEAVLSVIPGAAICEVNFVTRCIHRGESGTLNEATNSVVHEAENERGAKREILVGNRYPGGFESVSLECQKRN